MIPYLRRVLLFCGLTVIAGCGGGGGTAPLPIGASLRANTPGDTWHYDLTGTVTTQGLIFPGTGTLAASVGQANVGGTACLSLTESTRMDLNGIPPYLNTVTLYATQSANGDLVEIGDNQGQAGAVRLVTSPKVVYPGTWSADTSSSVRLDFSNGASEQKTLAVVGSEVIATPVGTFTTWKASETYTESDGDRTTVTSWWAPQIGAPVKLALSEVRTDGSGISVTGVLSSTSVPVR